jgi:hypothetical protein
MRIFSDDQFDCHVAALRGNQFEGHAFDPLPDNRWGWLQGVLLFLLCALHGKRFFFHPLASNDAAGAKTMALSLLEQAEVGTTIIQDGANRLFAPEECTCNAIYAWKGKAALQAIYDVFHSPLALEKNVSLVMIDCAH